MNAGGKTNRTIVALFITWSGPNEQGQARRENPKRMSTQTNIQTAGEPAVACTVLLN